MRCPRCLGAWDPDHVDLGAEHATCGPCDLVVALLGDVVPDIERDAVLSRLDVVGTAPALGDFVLSDVVKPRSLSVRAGASFFSSGSRLELDAEGARAKRPFRKTVALPLGEVRRFVPVASFSWDRDSQDEKSLVARACIVALPRGEAERPAPTLPTLSWQVARYLAARFERTRRALTETGIYR